MSDRPKVLAIEGASVLACAELTRPHVDECARRSLSRVNGCSQTEPSLRSWPALRVGCRGQPATPDPASATTTGGSCTPSFGPGRSTRTVGCPLPSESLLRTPGEAAARIATPPAWDHGFAKVGPALLPRCWSSSSCAKRLARGLDNRAPTDRWCVLDHPRSTFSGPGSDPASGRLVVDGSQEA